jgi:hypothetical protein
VDDKMKTDTVKYFLMFMGYPRSGHTLVASILNAHPRVVCSNQLFIIQNAEKRNLEGLLQNIENGSTDGYWKPEVKIAKAPKQDLYVVGDKTGHRTVEYLINNPEQLDHLKSIVPWPMKWIHICRNPFDCLATWTEKNLANKKRKGDVHANVRIEFNQAFEKFKALNEKIAQLKKTEKVLTLVHEKVVTNKDKTLEQLTNFFELDNKNTPIYKNWRNRVVKTLWKQPRITRHKIKWNNEMRNKVNNYTIRKYPWLKGYYYGG